MAPQLVERKDVRYWIFLQTTDLAIWKHTFHLGGEAKTHRCWQQLFMAYQNCTVIALPTASYWLPWLSHSQSHALATLKQVNCPETAIIDAKSGTSGGGRWLSDVTVRQITPWEHTARRVTAIPGN